MFDRLNVIEVLGACIDNLNQRLMLFSTELCDWKLSTKGNFTPKKECFQ